MKNVDPMVTWGADFWQKVLISGLGTLGALLVAVVLFYLKRWHDKRDLEADRQRGLAADLLKLVRDIRNSESDWKRAITQGPKDLWVYRDQLMELALVIEDENIARFAARYALFVSSVATVIHEIKERLGKDAFRDLGLKVENIDVLADALDKVEAMPGVAFQASVSLAEYLHGAGRLDASMFNDPLDRLPSKSDETT